MNRNMKDLILNENTSSYLYMFHTCFRQITSMFRQYQPMNNIETTIVELWPKKFVMDIISLPL
jgi:hypothetical protein